MRKNEKQGLLYLRQQIVGLAKQSELSSTNYEECSLSELERYEAQLDAYLKVLNLLDSLFFGK